MRYDVHCANCGTQEAWAPMSTSGEAPCPVCQRDRPKTITLPYYQEDRVRFFKGANGDGFSHALGEYMPDSRSERDRLAKKKGVEFVTLNEHLSENKEAKEAYDYRKHVDQGGARVLDKPAPATDAFVPTPEWAKPLIGA